MCTEGWAVLCCSHQKEIEDNPLLFVAHSTLLLEMQEGLGKKSWQTAIDCQKWLQAEPKNGPKVSARST
jgi:hypothetical protein